MAKGGGGYKQEFTGDARKLEREYEKIDKKLQSTQDELRRLKAESERSGEAAKAAGKKQVGAYDAARREARRLETQIKNTQASGGVVDPQDLARLKQLKTQMREAEAAVKSFDKAHDNSLSTFLRGHGIMNSANMALDMLRDRYEAIQSHQLGLRDSALELAAAQETAMKNMAGMPAAAKRQVLEQEIPGIMKRVGFADPIALTNAFGEVMSAGAQSQRDASAAVELAAVLNRNTPEAIGQLAASMFDLKKHLPDFDFTELGALQITSGRVSRIVDPKQLAKNLAPTIGAAAATYGGETLTKEQRRLLAAQTSALYGELTQRSGDFKGETARTGITRLLQQMEKFLAEKGVKRPESLFDTLEMFRRGAGNGFHEEFLANAGFEATVSPHIRKILEQGVAGDLADKASQVKFDSKAFEALAAEVAGGTRALKLATLHAAHKSDIAAFGFTDLAELHEYMAEAKEQLKQTALSMGLPRAEGVYGGSVDLVRSFLPEETQLHLMKKEIEARVRSVAAGKSGLLPFDVAMQPGNTDVETFIANVLASEAITQPQKDAIELGQKQLEKLDALIAAVNRLTAGNNRAAVGAAGVKQGE